MLKRALLCLSMVGAFALAPFSARAASAAADTPADAGVTEPAQPAAAPAPATAPAPECTYKGEAIPCEQLAAQFNEHPLDAASEVQQLWKGGGAVPSIILGLFALVAVASRRIPWLTEGKRAAYTASAGAFLAVLAEPATRGTTPTLGMLVGAIGAAVLLFTNAGKAPTTTGQATS